MNQTPLFLAPMAGYTDLPFRLLARACGADITVSEMVSAKGLVYGDKKTARLMRTVPEERPFGVQLFGSDPEILHKAAALCLERREEKDAHFDFIDFNAGCPAPKIVKNGDGSALLKDIGRLKACVAALVNDEVPVSVKTRIGFNAGDNVIEAAARAVREAGAALLTVHGRTRSQFYSGKSDWNAVKTAAQIMPVVLSGDITSARAAQAARATGAVGLMIGRAAVANPYIFREVRAALDGAPVCPADGREKIAAALELLALTQTYSPDPHSVVALRKQLAAMTKGIAGASALRRALFQADSFDGARALLKQAAEAL